MKIVFDTKSDKTGQIYFCNKFDIPKLSSTGYVLIKNPNEVMIYIDEYSSPIKLDQPELKVYKTCDEDRRSNYEKYFLKFCDTVFRAVTEGAVKGAGGADVAGLGENVTGLLQEVS